ncbi:MAG: Arm DNA-binding domain-containing protein [Planctomycetota bacterium]|nr:Arm DNA-binding domain-containing protein [Planctomycetota bacterium]
MPKRVNLGIRVIEAAAVPTGKQRIDLYDLKIHSLALQVMAGGSRVFDLFYRFNGRQRRYRLGTWPGVSVDQARDLAQRALVKIAGGVDPMDERQVIRSGMTLGMLWEHWRVNHADARLTATTRRTDGSRSDTTLKAWSGRQLSSI